MLLFFKISTVLYFSKLIINPIIIIIFVSFFNSIILVISKFNVFSFYLNIKSLLLFFIYKEKKTIYSFIKLNYILKTIN